MRARRLDLSIDGIHIGEEFNSFDRSSIESTAWPSTEWIVGCHRVYKVTARCDIDSSEQRVNHYK